MPNTLVHYAVGVALAHGAGYRGRQAWLLGGFAALPDADILTALAWQGVLALSTPPEGITAALSVVLGHRGWSHGVLALALAAVAALAATRSVKWTVWAALAFASHIVLDYLTTWPTYPLIPFSTAHGELGFLAIWDPVFTLVALAYLLCSFVSERGRGEWAWPPRPPRWMRAFRPSRWWRAAQACVVLFLLLLAGAGVAKAGISAATGAPFRDVEPLHLFQYTYVARQGDNYTVGVTPFLWWPGQTLTLPVITLGDGATEEDVPVVFDAANRMECTVVYNWSTRPLWHVARDGERILVDVSPARSAATNLGEGGFLMRFEYDTDGAFRRAGLLAGGTGELRQVHALTSLARCG